MAELDHLILCVREIDPSVDFYTGILGFEHEGTDPPFDLIRVSEGLQLQLVAAPSSTNEHLAFTVDRMEFDRTLERVRAAGIAYGSAWDRADDMRAPGRAPGARGIADAFYFEDPSQHLIEIRCYS